MTILAIETSCDDTGIAIIESKKASIKILSNVVSSQIKLHAQYGGVYPTLAKREHQRNLPFVFKKSLRKSGVSEKKIDAIAVTVGPGLEPCLWTGINFAKELAEKLNIPIIPINHIEAHILVNFIDQNAKRKMKNINRFAVSLHEKEKIFPAMCLVVSGGHTQLILTKSIGDYKIIGETRDDAAGECFDKTARILGLKYPGGPEIARLAARFQPNAKTNFSALAINLPRPMIYQKNYDFSFSGLKTAVLYDFQKRPKKIRESKRYKIETAHHIQQAIIDVLISKTLKVAQEYKIKSIILGGGVAANNELRKQLKAKVKNLHPKINLILPSQKLTTDNGLMIAMAAYFNRQKATKKWKNISANANLRI